MRFYLKNRIHFAALVTLLIVLASHPTLALAALGDHVDSPSTTEPRSTGSNRRNSTQRENYSVHESITGDTTVREFVSLDGVVFAVAWQGSTQPDLSPLLGSYFSEYRVALKSSVRVRGRRSFSQTRGSNVIVEKSGHMRVLQGRAYSVDLVPAGVDLNEIH